MTCPSRENMCLREALLRNDLTWHRWLWAQCKWTNNTYCIRCLWTKTHIKQDYAWIRWQKCVARDLQEPIPVFSLRVIAQYSLIKWLEKQRYRALFPNILGSIKLFFVYREWKNIVFISTTVTKKTVFSGRFYLFFINSLCQVSSPPLIIPVKHLFCFIGTVL